MNAAHSPEGRDEQSERVNAVDGAKNSVLHRACNVGSLELAAWCLKEKAEINVPNGQGDCPLHLAAKNGLGEMVALLLSHSADTKVRNRQNQTPLHVAVALGHMQGVQPLVEADPELVGAIDHHENTALHLVCGLSDANSSAQIADLLLTHGAQAAVANKKGQDPLHLAKSGPLVTLLGQQKEGVNRPDRDGNTPLHHAFFLGELDTIFKMLSIGGDPELLNLSGLLPFCMLRPSKNEIIPELFKGLPYITQHFCPKTEGDKSHWALQASAYGGLSVIPLIAKWTLGPFLPGIFNIALDLALPDSRQLTSLALSDAKQVSESESAPRWSEALFDDLFAKRAHVAMLVAELTTNIHGLTTHPKNDPEANTLVVPWLLGNPFLAQRIYLQNPEKFRANLERLKGLYPEGCFKVFEECHLEIPAEHFSSSPTSHSDPLESKVIHELVSFREQIIENMCEAFLLPLLGSHYLPHQARAPMIEYLKNIILGQIGSLINVPSSPSEVNKLSSAVFTLTMQKLFPSDDPNLSKPALHNQFQAYYHSRALITKIQSYLNELRKDTREGAIVIKWFQKHAPKDCEGDYIQEVVLEKGPDGFATGGIYRESVIELLIHLKCLKR